MQEFKASGKGPTVGEVYELLNNKASQNVSAQIQYSEDETTV